MLEDGELEMLQDRHTNTINDRAEREREEVDRFTE